MVDEPPASASSPRPRRTRPVVPRQNADLFETEFTRRVVPVATEVV